MPCFRVSKHRGDSACEQVAFGIERRQAEERERILVRELQHRSNNLLTVIQAIARRTLRPESSLADASARFEARLQALSRIHRRLVQSNWEGVALRDLIALELEPFATRVKATGPDVILNPQQAQSFSLALHELGTNALKYGALSNTNGYVEISWSFQAPGLRFHWRELDGPHVSRPVRQGFGTSLLGATFSDAQLEFNPEGIECEFSVQLPAEERRSHLSATPWESGASR